MPLVTLTARDGHELAAYRAEPDGPPKGGLVVIHEGSGLNRHIHEVADRLALEGYACVAPSLYDRIQRGVELGYDALSLARAAALVSRLDWFRVLLDVSAAIGAVSPAGRVGAVGYCFGGTVVWLAAARLEGLACAVSYYGSKIPDNLDREPRVPVMLHVGRRDVFLPPEKVAAIGRRYPQTQIHEYEAGHGFNCDHRADYDEDAAALAYERTLRFLREHVAEPRLG
jgi:carboxymethylenebutenolidase